MKITKRFRVFSFLLIFTLLLSLCAVTASDDTEIPQEIDEKETALNEIRDTFFNSSAEEASDLTAIEIDASRIIHQPQTYLEPIKPPKGGMVQSSAGLRSVLYAGPFEEDDTRLFRVAAGADLVYDAKVIMGKLVCQGSYANIWVLDDGDYHRVTGTAHTAGCHLTDITPVLAQDIANTYDAVCARMTNDFGEYAGVTVIPGYANVPAVGDLGGDGKINLLLYDLFGDGGGGGGYTAGFFWPSDFFTYGGPAINQADLGALGVASNHMNALDMIHIDVGHNQGFTALESSDERRLVMYNTLAHEFQHMLFFIHFGIYVASADLSYTWINESLSELAGTFYVQPGAEITDSGRTIPTAANNYDGTGYRDFLNFSGYKNYGISKLFAMLMYKKYGAAYTNGIYGYFKNTFPPAQNNTVHSQHQTQISAQGMAAIVGSCWEAATDLGSGGEDTFSIIYSLFMANFASDGGVIHYEGSAVQTVKHHGATRAVDNLWSIRPALGAAGFDGEDGKFPYNLTSYGAVPQLSSGGGVTLQGYGGSTAKGASHEMLYKLAGAGNASAPILEITVNDSSANTLYYVAVPNSGPAAGADIYPITKNTENSINTNGKPAYLFVSTLYQNVSVTPTFSWAAAGAGDLIGSVTLSPAAPKIGETVTASIDANGDDDYSYSWVLGETEVGEDADSYTIPADAGNVGKILTVTVTSASKDEGTICASTAVIAKKDNTNSPIVPVEASKTARIVTLAEVPGYEYSNGGQLWQDSPIFTGLVPGATYSFYQRIKATDTTAASAPSISLAVTLLTLSAVAQDNEDIAAAKEAVESAEYTVTQAELNGEEEARAFMESEIESIINGVDVDGIIITVESISFTEAQEGVGSNLSGVAGAYECVAGLEKGGGTKQFTDTLTLTITATPYIPSNNADLSALSISDGTLAPAFSPAVTSYTANVANNITGITVSAAPANPNANITGGGFQALSVGLNTIPVTVTAEDGGTVKTYTIAVTRADPPVQTINISAIPGITPPSAGAAPVTVITSTAQYTGSVSWTPSDNPFDYSTAYTATVTLTAETGYTLAGVAADFFTVAGAAATNGANSGVITAVFPATQASQDDDADITAAKIVIEGAALSYTAEQADAATIGQAKSAVEAIISRFELNGVNIEVVDGVFTAAAAGTVSAPAGTDGNYTFTVKLNKGAGSEQITAPLTLVITAAVYGGPFPSNNADLSALIISNGILTPAFSPAVASYTASVANNITGITVSATAGDSNAIVSGAGSTSLNVGSNSITITVTAEDRVTVKAYTITITRASGYTSTGQAPGGNTGGTSVFVGGNGYNNNPANNTNNADPSAEPNAPPEPVNNNTIPANNEQVNISYAKSNNSVKIELDNDKITEILSKTTDIAVFDFSKVSGAVSVTMPYKAAGSFSKENIGIEVKLPAGSVTFDNKAFASIASQTGKHDVIITISDAKSQLNDRQLAALNKLGAENRPVYDISVVSNGKYMRDFNGGTIKISIPYKLKSGEKPSRLGVWFLDDNGSVKEHKTVYDTPAKSVIFSTAHLSKYVIAYKKDWVNPFTDVSSRQWFYEAVRFVNENNLFGGINANTFAPYESMTRAMFVAILYNAEGAPAVSGKEPFNDVSAADWYSAAVKWAEKTGLVTGYGHGRFGPADMITREQVAAILFRYVKYKGQTPADRAVNLDFTDADKIAGYAYESVTWCYMSGIIDEKSAKVFDPKAAATRAEVAQIVMRFLETY